MLNTKDLRKYRRNSNDRKINWQKELLESGKFNDKFSKNLLEHGAKNFMQVISHYQTFTNEYPQNLSSLHPKQRIRVPSGIEVLIRE